MITVISGGRQFLMQNMHFEFLRRKIVSIPITAAIIGGADGVDTAAYDFLKDWGILPTIVKPNYKKHAWQVAPRARNVTMAQMARLDPAKGALVAFPGAEGTAHMIETAYRWGLALHLCHGAPISRRLKTLWLRQGMIWYDDGIEIKIERPT